MDSNHDMEHGIMEMKDDEWRGPDAQNTESEYGWAVLEK